MGDVIDLGDLSGITRSDAVQAVYTYLQDNMPAGADGTPWQPAVGALDDLLINGFGQQVDELTTLLSTASTSAFRFSHGRHTRIPARRSEASLGDLYGIAHGPDD